jgi:hypothetical protein
VPRTSPFCDAVVSATVELLEEMKSLTGRR